MASDLKDALKAVCIVIALLAVIGFIALGFNLYHDSLYLNKGFIKDVQGHWVMVPRCN